MKNTFELTGLESYSPNVTCPVAFLAGAPKGVCASLPPISMDYFIIPFTIEHLRNGNPDDIYAINPNPASTNFVIQQLNMDS